MDKKRLEAHMNDGKTEYVMCAAIHVDDGESYSYQPYNCLLYTSDAADEL